MTSTGSYLPQQAPSTAAESARLLAQARAIFEREDAALRRAGLGDGARHLDVGCGPGHWLSQLRAAHRPSLVLGVERDPLHARHAITQLPVVRGDAAALPLRDGAFDAVTMRLVLRHLTQPAAALAELARVTRVGGVVCVLDADDGGLLLQDAPVSFAPLWEALRVTAVRRGANPHVGRALPGLLAGAGLQNISLEPLVVTTLELEPPAFVELLLAPGARPVDVDLMEREAVARAWEDLRAWARRDGAFGLAVGMLATGTRMP